MSFFDPYHISEYNGYYTKKGQVIQKRHVERNPAVTLKDKEKAIKILNAFGYKAVPIDEPVPVPMEKYTFFDTRVLSLSEPFSLPIGQYQPYLLKTFLSWVPALSIFSQVTSDDVESIKIDFRLTNYGGSFSSNIFGRDFNIILSEGENQGTITGFSLNSNQGGELIIYPDYKDGYVFSDFNKGTTAELNNVDISGVIAGSLNQEIVTGGSQLYELISQNDFSDPQFNKNIVQIRNTGSAAIPVNNLFAYFSIYVEVIYKLEFD